jgi:hypothetical protein
MDPSPGTLEDRVRALEEQMRRSQADQAPTPLTPTEEEKIKRAAERFKKANSQSKAPDALRGLAETLTELGEKIKGLSKDGDAIRALSDLGIGLAAPKELARLAPKITELAKLMR